uniref:Slc25a-14 n=1 Tax=Schmidtea mediterranea TaxID=79327 RepID=A0A0H3YFE8_SCHMD|nr:slc25a-14 [Schmidtea mediterranea]
MAHLKITQKNSARESAFAGAASGFVSRAMVQPLDVLKIRLQLQVEPLKKKFGKYHGIFPTICCIYKEEGFKALWKGHMCGQIHAISFSMIQFYTYTCLIEKYKFSLQRHSTFSEKLISNFFCGSLSGILAISLTQPLDILRTRFVAQGEPKLYRSLYHAAASIVQKEGFLTLYRGSIPSILLIAPQSGLQFLFYNFSNAVIGSIFSLFRFYENKNELKIGVVQSIASGGMAGALSKVLVFPLDIVKKRMQVQGFEEARKKFGKLHRSQGFIRCFGVIYREEGWTAFTKGLKPTLLKSFISIGLKFSVYEQAYQLLTGVQMANCIY